MKQSRVLLPDHVLDALKEGDAVEGESLFPGLSSEPVVWKCLESVRTQVNIVGRHRLTLHAYYRDVFIKSVIIERRSDAADEWRYA
jgi:hypothetical protein